MKLRSGLSLIRQFLELDYQAESFDAVLCVFGIFFVPDMPAAVRELWRSSRHCDQKIELNQCDFGNYFALFLVR